MFIVLILFQLLSLSQLMTQLVAQLKFSGPITVQMDACVKSMQKIVCLFLGSSAFDGYWPLLLYLLCQSQVCCLDNQPVAIATAKMHQYNHHFYNNNNSFQDCYDIIYCILTLHYIRYILQLFLSIKIRS